MVSVRQVKAARALPAWSQGELAAASGVSHPKVRRLEATYGMIRGREETGTKGQAAFVAAGVEFIPENGGGAGVRLRDRSDPHDEGKRPDELDATNDDGGRRIGTDDASLRPS